MEIFKDKKIKNIIIICITLISLLELYFAYKVLKEYRGIYQIGVFILFIYQPFLYNNLFRKQLSHYKLRIVIIGLMSLLLPLTIYFTLPKYTYNEGKQFVEQYLEQSKSVKFVDYSFGKDTIPVYNNPKQLFVSDRAYYYTITSTEGTKYFMVNPLTGKLHQMSQGVW